MVKFPKKMEKDIRCFGFENYCYKNLFLLRKIKEIISKQDYIPKIDIFSDLDYGHLGRQSDDVMILYLSGENIYYRFQHHLNRIVLGILNKNKRVVRIFLWIFCICKKLNKNSGFMYSILYSNNNNNKRYIVLTNDIQGDYILNFPYFLHLFFGRFDKFIKVESQKLYRDKSKFCAFIMSNGRDKNRINFFHKLSKYKKIDSYGKVLNNSKISEDLIKKYKKDDILDYNSLNQELFREYKFVICFENSCAKDYITEKLPNVMMANSIGIYRGAPNVDEFFNTDSFINYDNYGGSYDKMIEKIIELDQDDEKYNAMLDQPFFSNNKFPPRIETAEKDLEDFILKMIKS